MRKLLTTALLVAAAGTAMASEGDELTSLSYISYLERYATVQPATQEDSVEAAINMPLIPGDRIDTAREARMEVVLADGNSLWLDEYTTLSLDAVAYSRDGAADQTVLFLGEGTVMIEVSSHRLDQSPVRIDGRGATVYLNDAGLYRVLALPSGGLRLEVVEGLAEAATVAGGVLVRASSAAEIEGGEVLATDQQLTWGDDFAAWVEQRRQVAQGESTMFVDARYGRQASQLDSYGNWVYVSDLNTWAWQPAVSASWRPYTAGRWYWTPVGWSWVSYEPWGWLPYHYGSWYLSAGFGWVWSWHPYWSPAWVSWTWWPGYVGWYPCGYYAGWYWPRYGSYYGYPYWPNDPGHPGGGGPVPPRRAAIPRPGAGGPGADEPGGGRAAMARPAEMALDLKGRARLSEVDSSAWNVVSTRDFASPHLSRLVEPGDTALRGRNEVGVVMSDPLTTAPPSQARPSGELERVFRGVERTADRDITPILARDAGLRGEDALRLVEPTTAGAISRRSAAVVAAPSAPTRQVAERPVLTVSPSSPLYDRSGSSASSRSVVASTPRSPSQDAPAHVNPFVPRSRPSSAVIPSTGRGVASGSAGSRAPLSSGTTNRAPSSRVIPQPGSASAPVIVPRTAPSVSRPSSGSSGSVSRSPSSSIRRPSSSTVRPSTTNRRPPTTMRAPSSAGRGRSATAPRSAPTSASRPSSSSQRRN